MKQPWIRTAATDSILILLPPFAVLAAIFMFPDFWDDAAEQYSFYTWLFLIVFIDVAHVYATIFKTYLAPAEYRARKKLLLLLPAISFVAGFVLFLLGSRVFWTTLAYVAVFHFIRQQYGFMRLYSRNEIKTPAGSLIDNVTIYSAAGYPMLYWFLGPERHFTWFMPDEFFRWENPLALKWAGYIYLVILVIYIGRVIAMYSKTGFFNIPKNAVIFGTGLSWYFGIVYFDNDLIFSLLNVVSHGLPYIGLVYLRELSAGGDRLIAPFKTMRVPVLALSYVAVLLVFAFSEEYLWEIMVWNEHFSATGLRFDGLRFLLVPLLAMPQLTHYLLHGFIWKGNKKAEHSPAFQSKI